MTAPMVGDFAFKWAFLMAIYASMAGLWACQRRSSLRLQQSVRGAIIALAVSLSTAVLILEHLFVAGDYAVRAVYDHTDRTLPLLYKMAALWGGDCGSVLFWAWILSLYLAFIAARATVAPRLLTSTVLAVATPLEIFFTGLLIWVVNPFATVWPHAVNGAGLDPLLRNPVMLVHPPAMYTGLIGMVIPLAYLLSGLLRRLPWPQWIGAVRVWMLFSWLWLSAALILGGMWAYLELGWGGYWEWDPVENAALLPWLTATACLHALQVEERRGQHRWWTALLAAATFLLTLIGTYITRSGVLKNSVHAFTGTGIGSYFAGLFLVSLVTIAVIFVMRRDMLDDRGPAQVDGMAKESVYRLLETTIVIMAALVLAGTFYPVITQTLSHQTIILRQGFFNQSVSPLFLLIIGLMGIAPIMSWQQNSWPVLTAQTGSLAASGLVGVAVAFLGGDRTPLSLVGVFVITTALASMLREFYRAGRARSVGLGFWQGLWSAFVAHRRRYGGYMAHLAFLLVALGVLGSHTNALALTRTLRPGQFITVAGYRLYYRGIASRPRFSGLSTQAVLVVSYHGRSWISRPGLAFYAGSAAPVADPSIHEGFMQDLYVVVDAISAHQAVLLHVMINPCVLWIWSGLPLLVAGAGLALSGRRSARLSIVHDHALGPTTHDTPIGSDGL
ncbi:MAG: cytochrome C assembly protein [Sulfobacillus acidophilus]|uniref:Cytochrome C assembly protein n=1 Tax=Sulfobacillus acidophilus TaxID=53633 RepID=A0A2T2WPB0_9FIRM|nr:MAG: cytochrome C assembly protein [Sulfobacillus acidophilus]